MKHINYKLADGTIEKVEVTDEIAEMLLEEKRYFWKMKKRKVRHESFTSIEEREEQGEVVAVDVLSPLDLIIKQEDEEAQNKLLLLLPVAISKLNPRQQEMVKMIFYENKTQVEVAKYYGITKYSVSDAMQRIYASLRRILEK